MTHNKEELAERDKQISMIDEFIASHEQSLEDFNQILYHCEQIDKRIRFISRAAGVEPKLVRRSFSRIGAYSHLFDID